MCLTLQNIEKSYGSKKVLKGFSMRAKKGEVTALIGKNGVGKTTTFKILSGLITKESGEVTWNSENVNCQSLNWKRNLGYLPEHNPLYPEMYVKEFLAYSFGLFKLKKGSNDLSKIINTVGLDTHQSSKIKNLSKGYKQRVGIAQAIINNPALLILDEPTSGLDPAQMIEIRSLIRQLAQDRVVILSSHILSEVENICDHVVMISKGIAAPIEQIKPELMHVEFDQSVESKWFESVGNIVSNQRSKIAIELKEDKNGGDIFDIAVNQGLKIKEMARSQNSLEAFFTENS